MSLAPFLTPQPYGTFDFSAITPGMVPPALAEARRIHRAEVEAILSNPEPPTFENLLVPLQRAGRELTRVKAAFSVYSSALITPEVQAIVRDEAPRDAAHADAISLDPRLWARVDELHRTRAGVPSTQGAARLLDDTHLGLRNAGALLAPSAKARIMAINQEAAGLEAEFEERLLSAREASLVTGWDAAELAGLPRDQREAALAHDKAPPGGWAIDIVNTTQQPASAFLLDGTLRRRLYDASLARNLAGEDETLSLVSRIERLRAEAAGLLGYPSYAALALSDQMAGSPEAAMALTARFGRAAMAKAASEATALGGVPPWDRLFAEEQARRCAHALDEEEVKAYFEFERTLEDGLFFMARELYGITFSRRADLQTWHADVRVYEVRDAGGQPRALFYLDPFQRPGKSGGAWMEELVGQSRLEGTLAVVTNSLNLTRPAPGRPALLSLEEVKTLFHEFGHGLHAMLSDVEYPSQAGTRVATDFVELPSQLHEHWVLHPHLVEHYARHHETGEVIPAGLLSRLRAAETFGNGYRITELAAAATLDLAWHMRPPSAPALSSEEARAFDRSALAGEGFDVDAVPPRYGTPYFAHVWCGGYAASYNAYIFSNVLDCDGFAWFEENGGLTRANGEHFRRTLLSRGASAAPEDLFREFRGRDPDIGPALRDKGLVEDVPRSAPRPRP